MIHKIMYHIEYGVKPRHRNYYVYMRHVVCVYMYLHTSHECRPLGTLTLSLTPSPITLTHHPFAHHPHPSSPTPNAKTTCAVDVFSVRNRQMTALNTVKVSYDASTPTVEIASLLSSLNTWPLPALDFHFVYATNRITAF